MNTISKILKYMSSPSYRVIVNASRGRYDGLSDEEYLKKLFLARVGYPLDLNNPRTFNEKLQWLKLYNRNELFTAMVDKVAVKQIVSEKIGESFVIPTIRVYDDPSDIDFNELPKKFVMKCNHNSGGLCICKDKNKLNTAKVIEEFKKAFAFDYYLRSREWPYKNVNRKILVEEYVQDGDSPFLPVYKFFCFDGKPVIIQTIQNDKQPNESIDYFDTDWQLLDLRQNFSNSAIPLRKPTHLEKMLGVVSILSEGIPFIRVDLYVINDEIKFSEFTFFSDSGLERFYPEKWDLELGEMINLPSRVS